MSGDTQDAMREMGELLDPVQEQLRRMLHEFGDEHYHTCPSDNDSGPCDCFAGHLIVRARAVLEAAVKDRRTAGQTLSEDRG